MLVPQHPCTHCKCNLSKYCRINITDPIEKSKFEQEPSLVHNSSQVKWSGVHERHLVRITGTVVVVHLCRSKIKSDPKPDGGWGRGRVMFLSFISEISMQF